MKKKLCNRGGTKSSKMSKGRNASKKLGTTALDDVQSFLGYLLLTKLSFQILFLLFSITCTSVTRGIMMNRRQLLVQASLPLTQVCQFDFF